MRQFLTGRTAEHYGGDGSHIHANQYFTLPGRPGWRCGTGAGEAPNGNAVCRKGRRGAFAGSYPR